MVLMPAPDLGPDTIDVRRDIGITWIEQADRATDHAGRCDDMDDCTRCNILAVGDILDGILPVEWLFPQDGRAGPTHVTIKRHLGAALLGRLLTTTAEAQHTTDDYDTCSACSIARLSHVVDRALPPRWYLHDLAADGKVS